MKDQIEGTIKEQAGKLTDDESTELEGKAQKHKGEAKDALAGKLNDADDALTREQDA
ncbi:MAG: CsbD-like [Gaiellaceae bacterium]|jgi:uncharacterized protein YjbJ (UPF0337 family)|nr:CsbD-like [Gaiellaceae bacterium]